MAEQEKTEKKENKRPKQEETEVLVRIFGQDILGSKNIYTGLTKIKGISWAVSNAICLTLGLDKTKKVSDLSEKEIEGIESFLEKIELPEFLKNRKNDPESSESSHLFSTNLDLTKEFDIKRKKKIKSYQGVRHTSKLPVRGQRTRANFRARGKSVGVKRKK